MPAAKSMANQVRLEYSGDSFLSTEANLAKRGNNQKEAEYYEEVNDVHEPPVEVRGQPFSGSPEEVCCPFPKHEGPDNKNDDGDCGNQEYRCQPKYLGIVLGLFSFFVHFQNSPFQRVVSYQYSVSG